MLQVDQNIAKYLKENDPVNLSVWRAIKTEFLNYKTAKAGNVITEQVEVSIIGKMLAQRYDAAQQFRQGGRVDLAEREEKEAAVLETLIPKEPTEEELTKAINDAIITIKKEQGDDYVVSMQNMKFIQTFVRNRFSNVNGGKIAEIFRKLL